MASEAGEKMGLRKIIIKPNSRSEKLLRPLYCTPRVRALVGHIQSNMSPWKSPINSYTVCVYVEYIMSIPNKLNVYLARHNAFIMIMKNIGLL